MSEVDHFWFWVVVKQNTSFDPWEMHLREKKGKITVRDWAKK